MRCLLLVASATAPALSQTNLYGTVRDASGALAAGATVSLTCNASPSLSLQAKAAADGTFRVSGILFCRYQVIAEQKRLKSVPVLLEITASSPGETQLDLTFATEDSSLDETPPRPKFAASGIRGLIDPGGYSAPANSAAASALLTGMAEVNRVGVSEASGCSVGSLTELEKAHDNSPHDPAASYALANALIATQKFAQARTLLLGFAGEDPATASDPRALALLAQADEGVEAFDKAALLYQRLAALNPSAENAFSEGYELILAGHTAAAATTYAKSLILYPNSTSLIIGAGTAEFLQQHMSHAVALFLRAAAIDSRDPRPYPFLAAASSVSGVDGEPVLTMMLHHLEVAPTDAPGHLAFAAALLHLQERGPQQASTSERAEAELRRSLALAPELSEAHYELALVLTRRGADDEAIRELELAAQLDPARREAHYRLALLLRKVGQPAAASLEMKQFQDIRAEDSAAGSDLRRYLSVMRKPAAGDSVCRQK